MNTRRSGFKIMMGLLAMVKPLTMYMLLCITLGVLGFLCAISITVLGISILLLHLGILSWNMTLSTIISMMIFSAVFRAILRYGEQMTGHFIAFKLLALLRDKVFSKLRTLAPAKLETRNRGDLISIITSDIELLEVFYAHTIAPVAIAFIVSLIMVSVIWQIHYILGIIAFIAYITVGYIIPVYTSKLGNKHGMEFRNRLGQLNSYFLESVRGIRESIQFRDVSNREKNVEGQTEHLNKLHFQLKSHEGITAALSSSAVLILPFIVLFAGYELGVSSGDTILAAVMLSASFGPVFALSNLSEVLTKTLACGERVLGLLEEEPETLEIEEGIKPEYDGVVVDNLTFAYNEEKILEDISVTLEKNKTVAITGNSGSGKSTLLKLIMRFWNSPKDAVKISETDVGVINTEHLRTLESFMTQETDLFRDTIEANIKIAKADATREEVIEAAKKASVHDFIMTLPKGYDTMVGELGDTLSGGEKQRIGLARVFLHNAPLILLDEPTSNLDSLNEAVILSSLKGGIKDGTVVLVSHRKSALAIADKIYNLESQRQS